MEREQNVTGAMVWIRPNPPPEGHGLNPAPGHELGSTEEKGQHSTI